MDKILSIKELQQDIASLLDYLHLTEESRWNKVFIRESVLKNMKRYDENIRYYHTPVETNEFVKLIYSKHDLHDLIGTLTNKYVALGKLVVKEEYAHLVEQ